MNSEEFKEIGKSLSPVTMGRGDWVVSWISGDVGVVSEVWEAEEPDIGPVLLPDGSLAYVDNHGDIVDLIPARRLLRVRRKDAAP